VIVIQTKATRLNPFVFGQALLSMELIKQRWTPNSLHSVLICAADDPELRPIVEQYPGLRVHVDQSAKVGHFYLTRWPGAARYLSERSRATVLAPTKLTSRMSVEGVLVPAPGRPGGTSIAAQVAGQHVTSVHSDVGRGAGALGMWVSGEAIITQALLRQMGAASATSTIIVRRRGDSAVEPALRRFASYDLLTLETILSCPPQGM
jgi:hypothetical protein